MKRTNVAKWLEKYSRWQIKVQKDGERRTFTCSTPGRAGQRACHAKADAWLDDNITCSSIKTEVIFAEFVESLKLTTSRSNWEKFESFGRTWLLPSIGKRHIGDVTEQDLQDIIAKGYAKGLARKTLQNNRAMLIGFLKYCRRRKCTTLLPESLSIPKGARRAQKQILQPEHLLVLFSSSHTQLREKKIPEPLIHAYRFQVLTGLRPGELLGLEWADIRGNEVFVSRSINDHCEITTGKNDNAIRRFFMTENAAAELRAQRQICDPTEPRVFGDIKPQTYRKRWYVYCDANSIPHVTPYEMRHTFVSIAKRLPEGQIRPLVGHSKNMDTFGVYAHEVNGELQATANELDAIFDALIHSQPTS